LSAVDVTGVGKTYGGAVVLDNIHAQFREGGFTSLLGPSGSGKTTLLRIVAGFVAPDSGRVRIGGRDVTDVPVHARNIGMVFQSYALFPHMTVMENVAFGLHRRGVRGADLKRRVGGVLAMVKLDALAERLPKQLSGGQQQRVALARAIVIEPTVLLLDEPLSALDRRLRQEMQVELRRIQRDSGLTTIFVTHDQEEALALSDHIAILDRGRIVQEGAPIAIYERPTTRFAAAFLGDANFLAGTPVAGGLDVAGHIVRIDGAAATPTVAIRPEKMTLLAEGIAADGFDNVLPATIRQVVYAGAATTYLLDGDDGTPLRVFAQNRDGGPVAPGSRVMLGWSAAHTIPVTD
jgi:putative spermidine/putrescine transport system ATP-binding protein/spermidine/putrescine transport system ATP-binding protein